MRTLFLLFITMLSIGWTQTTKTTHIVVKVDDRQEALQLLKSKVKSFGGYFSDLSDYSISLKVPVSSMEDVIKLVEKQGYLVSKSYSSQENNYEMIKLQSLIDAKKKLLSDYRSLLKNATPESIVSIEREMIKLNVDIEDNMGRLKYLKKTSAIATIHINLRFHERTPPVKSATSDFKWVNNLNLGDLLEEYR